jgi:hypothetical protein
MKVGKVSLFATVGIIVVLIAVVRGSGAQEANEAPPGWDTIRVAADGVGLSYQVWWDWSPLIVPTPDGGAWAFFSAVAAPPSSATPAAAGTQRLYASRFDPERHVWLPATTMPGGEIQFAPTAAVASDGTMHLVYTDRATGNPDSFGAVVYTRSDGNGGWTPPMAISPDPNAGHQLAPSIAIDQTGQLHVVWQDQRAVDPSLRQNDASNADIFYSSLSGDAWTAPVQLDTRPNPTTYFSRPQLAIDGDRLVAVWSVYDQADARSAIRLEWSTRALNGEATWTPAQSLLDRTSADVFFGGRLVDVASDPSGGVVLVYGTRTVTAATPQATASADLYLRRLPAGSSTWNGDILLGSGDRGAYPSVAVAGDGTVYATYNVGSGDSVNVAAVAIAAGSDTPGPEVILSPGEDGAQGVPVIAVDATGTVWVLYLAERAAGDVNQIRVVRGATIPTS